MNVNMSLSNSVVADAVNAAMPRQDDPKFVCLPPEIRCMIYRHIFADLHIRFVGWTSTRGDYWSIRSTCRALRDDPFLEVELLRSSTIDITSFFDCTSFKRRLSPARRSPIRSLCINLPNHHSKCICDFDRSQDCDLTKKKARPDGRRFQSLFDISPNLQTITVEFREKPAVNLFRHCYDYTFTDVCASHDHNGETVKTMSDKAADLLHNLRVLSRWTSIHNSPLVHLVGDLHERDPNFFDRSLQCSYERAARKNYMTSYEDMIRGALQRGIEVRFVLHLIFKDTPPKRTAQCGNVFDYGFSEIAWFETTGIVSSKDWILRVNHVDDQGREKVWKFKQVPIRFDGEAEGDGLKMYIS